MNKQERALRNALDRFTPEMRAAFTQAIRDAAVSVDQRRLAYLIEQGRIEEAVQLLRIDQSLFAPLKDAIRGAYAQGGALAEQIAPAGLTGVFRFDGTQAAAMQWVLTRGADLVHGITDEGIATARKVIAAGLDEGLSSSEVARSITGRKIGKQRVGGFLGLTEQQADSIIAGRAKLASGDPAQMREYLQLKLRDTRYDAQIKRAIKEGKAIKGADLDRIMEAHRSKALGYRGRVVAKHESHQALAAGRAEGMSQMLARDDVEAVTCRWQHNLSVEPRPDHVAMSGTVVEYGQAFDFPDGTQMRWPHDENAPARHTIGCRCVGIFRVKLRRQ
ncbi:hypothetical protein [Thioclava sp.]|uniref:hypothetical protein n=1 Tax=Thioclava sp. TaxID=1933450 RepID=UPI003242BBC6